MFPIAQDRLVASRQHQLRTEADAARLSRINRPEPRIDHRVRNALSLRIQFAR